MQENYHGRLFMTGILSLIFILVIILIAVIFVTYRTGSPAQVATTTQSVTPTVAPTAAQAPKYRGSFLLHVENDQREFSVGDTITIEVFADSDGQPVVGYDLDLDVVGGAQFAQAKSSVDDFDMHPTTRAGGLYITSLKNLTSTATTIFTDVPVATIAFTATAPGTVMITPKFIVGETSHSNLMSISSESVLSSVEGVSVTVN